MWICIKSFWLQADLLLYNILTFDNSLDSWITTFIYYFIKFIFIYFCNENNISALLYYIFISTFICTLNVYYFTVRARWRFWVMKNLDWEGDFSRDGIPFECLVGYRAGKHECNKCVVRRRTLNELFRNVYTPRRHRDKQYARFTIELSGHERITTAINDCVDCSL